MTKALRETDIYKDQNILKIASEGKTIAWMTRLGRPTARFDDKTVTGTHIFKLFFSHAATVNTSYDVQHVTYM